VPISCPRANDRPVQKCLGRFAWCDGDLDRAERIRSTIPFARGGQARNVSSRSLHIQVEPIPARGRLHGSPVGTFRVTTHHERRIRLLDRPRVRIDAVKLDMPPGVARVRLCPQRDHGLDIVVGS
jgi:hypothetical protein